LISGFDSLGSPRNRLLITFFFLIHKCFRTGFETNVIDLNIGLTTVAFYRFTNDLLYLIRI